MGFNSFAACWFFGYRSGVLKQAKDCVSDIGVPECPWNILPGTTSSITSVPTSSMGMVGKYRSEGVLVCLLQGYLVCLPLFSMKLVAASKPTNLNRKPYIARSWSLRDIALVPAGILKI